MGAALESYRDEGPGQDAPSRAGRIAVQQSTGGHVAANAQTVPNLVEFRHGRWWDGFYLIWLILRFIIVAEWAARAREVYVAIAGRGADQVDPRV